MPTSKLSRTKGRSPKGAFEEDSPKLTIPVTPERDHIQGPFNAPLTLVEYGDYQCPYCGAAYPEIKRVQQQLGSKLRFVFRNFPITGAHEFAERGAEIAEASGAQGKFWEMHDYLYEHQNLLGDVDAILTYASTLRLDVEKLGREIAGHAYLDKIKEDFNGGVRSGVNGTPTFFISEKRYNGPPTADALLEMLESSA